MFPIKTDWKFRKVEINEDAVNILFRDKITGNDELPSLPGTGSSFPLFPPFPSIPFYATFREQEIIISICLRFVNTSDSRSPIKSLFNFPNYAASRAK